MAKVHYNWIDWMKVIGMYCIVAGHLQPLGYEYFYVFSVPLFFIISGFLGKHEEEDRLFWKKLFYNLILPCIVICLVNLGLGLLLNRIQWQDIYLRIFNCLLGFQGDGKQGGGLGMCWFLYTLIICKIINQYISHKRYLHWLVLAACVVFAVWYNDNNFHWYNAISNTSLAYPMYVCGGGYKYLYNKQYHCESKFQNAVVLIICCIWVFLIRKFNGPTYMYNNEYGSNILLSFIGGNAGSIAVYILCKKLQNIHINVVDVISKGTILILGFHGWFLWFNYLIPLSTVIKYVGTLFILLLFVPVIIVAEKKFPVFLGLRAKNEFKK